MLSFFRRGITAKIMLGVLALGLFAIVITGFGTGGSGLGSIGTGADTVASAGSEPVTSKEVSDRIDRQLAAAREQQPDLDMGTFLQSGAYEQIVRGLLSAKALLAFGRDAGLAVSKRLIDGEIASVPAFHNLAGQFDQAIFRAALQRRSTSEQQLRDELEATLIQRQLLLPVAANAQAPQSVALEYASLLLERRTGSIGIVPAASMPAGAPPTAAEIETYYSRNRARYTVPERRVLRYATFGAADVAAAAQPTEAEIAEAYRADAVRFAASETRDLSQVVLPSREAAQTFAAKLARGTGFAQAAAEAGFSNADTRRAGQSKSGFAGVTSAAVADAAFAAAESATTAPVQSPYGWHVVRVDTVTRIGGKTLEAARAELSAEVGIRKRQEALTALVERIEDGIAEGASFAEVARDNRLAARDSAPVTAGAADDPAAAAIAPLLKIAFDLGEDDDPVVEPLGPDSYALMTIARVLPAAPPPLAEVRTRVAADLVARRRADRARETASRIVAAINRGQSAAQAFAGAGVPLPAPRPVNARRLELARGGGQVPPPLAMLFTMKRGTAKLLDAPQGAGWYVVHLTGTEAGDATRDPALVAAARAEFSTLLGREYADQFAAAAERHVGVKRDEGAIAALRRQLLGPGAQ